MFYSLLSDIWNTLLDLQTQLIRFLIIHSMFWVINFTLIFITLFINFSAANKTDLIELHIQIPFLFNLMQT